MNSFDVFKSDFGKVFVMSRRVFDKRIDKDIECDTKMIGCLQVCHDWFTPMESIKPRQEIT